MNPIQPMLATLVDQPFDRPGWVYEEKYDGIRAVAHRRRGKVTLFTRTPRDVTAQFPDVAAAVAGLDDGDLVLDGEIVTLDQRGVSRFQLLQRGGTNLYAVFDCLERNGESLLARPLAERRRALEALIPERGEVLLRSRRLAQDGFAAFRFAEKHGWEGIVAKDEAAPYEPGRRSRAWLKVKCRLQAEFVIGGFTAPQGARQGFGALLVGLYDGPRLRYTGKVGTGFPAPVLAQLVARMKALRTDDPPFDPPPGERAVTWVRPELVGEIAYAEWTGDGKLRHPAFLGLRDDKRPHECTWTDRER